jgi:hypothetical protein
MESKDKKPSATGEGYLFRLVDDRFETAEDPWLLCENAAVNMIVVLDRCWNDLPDRVQSQTYAPGPAIKPIRVTAVLWHIVMVWASSRLR